MSRSQGRTTRTPLPGRYWRQWAATAVSNVGDGMTGAAMPLLAYSLTTDERLLALVSFASFIPWFVLALPVGVYVDRYNRQRLMIVANIVRAMLFSVIAVTAANGSLSIGVLVVLLLAVGCCEVVFDSSAQAFLPSIVDDAQLPRANGVLYATEVVCNGFLGLPFGAWLWVIAVGVPFGVNAASFALAAFVVATITPSRPFVPTTERPEPFRRQLAEGLHWLRRHRLLRTLAVMLGITNMCFQMGEALFVKFAADELGLGARGFGLLLAVMSVGSIIGGLLGDRIGDRLGHRTALIASYGAFGASEILTGLAPAAWLVVVSSLITGIASNVWNIITVSMRQRIIPPELFGRVNSAYRWIGTGSIGIGAIIGGQIAYTTGLRAPFLVGGAITLMALAVFAGTVTREMSSAPPAGRSQTP